MWVLEKQKLQFVQHLKLVSMGSRLLYWCQQPFLLFSIIKLLANGLKDFPVTVDYINRFKSAKEKKETLKKLEEGKIEIIIGTHALLGKEVKYKDLGLLGY
jgi:hypothetical protein